MLNSPAYSLLTWLMRLVLVGFIVERVLEPDLVAVMTLSLFLVLSFGYLLREDRLPNVFDALVALAALLNAAGFVFSWYKQVDLYDNVAHAITIFALTLAYYFLVYPGSVHGSSRIVTAVSVLTFGVTLGAFWEIAEWTTGQVLDANVVFGLDDAITDLISNSIGALLAALIGVWLRTRAGHGRSEPLRSQPIG